VTYFETGEAAKWHSQTLSHTSPFQFHTD